MKFYFEKRVVLGFLAAMAIIVWLGINSFFNSKKFATTSNLVAHTNEVLFHTEKLLSCVMAIETEQRGYVITKNDSFLKPIELGTDTLDNHLQNLTRLTGDNGHQQKRLAILKDLVTRKMAFARKVIEARRRSFQAAVDTVQSMKGKALMGKIAASIAEIQKEEYALLEQRIAVTEINFKRFNNTLSYLLVATAVILILVFIAIHFSAKAQNKYAFALRTASDEIKDLYENAPCGYYSLDDRGVFVNINKTLLTWLDYDRDDIVNKLYFKDIIVPETRATFDKNFEQFKKQGYVNNLEFVFVRKNGSAFPVLLNSTAIVDQNNHFVKSRSIVFDITESKAAENKIKQLNNELEAFAYSVSHDLRSPLRSIDGYTKILEEEYGTHLDDEGKRLMQVIMNNAKRMGQLIDDLLNFSRIGRKELVKTNFDTRKLVETVMQEQLESNRERHIQFKIDELHASYGDIVMMRQVWENLISNAIKYTRRNTEAIIEIGSYIDKKNVAFFIRDNGVGFDMAYSQKLFGVFQRLHKIQEFEGTGVGLAIVYRIVTRHGGRVWADATLNEGATFAFTLPSIDESNNESHDQ